MPFLAAVPAAAWIGLGTAAASTGLGAYQAHEAKKSAKEAQKESLQTWQQTAYPSSEAVKATATENRGQLAQGRLGAYQNLASSMAARGFGSGSGNILGGAQDIERSYLQSLGKMGTDLTKYATTPMWGPPSSAYSSPVTGSLEAGLGQGKSMMDTAMGYYMMKNLFGNT